MNWNTLYITGTGDFWEDVLKKLLHDEINFLSGHSEQKSETKFQGLIWLDHSVTLQDFKKAVSAKLIWKYRLRFYLNPEGDLDNLENKNARFTDDLVVQGSLLFQ